MNSIFNAPNPVMIEMARDAGGFTQAQFAKAIGCSSATLSRIEAGTVVASSDQVRAMSELTGHPVGFFHQQDVKRIPIGRSLHSLAL